MPLLTPSPVPDPLTTCGLVGTSPPVRALCDSILRIAPTDLPVLIEGESGTGKELVARAIHLRSPRALKPFEPENCAALPDHLAESECFGHEKGAFTGAGTSHAGLFERAHGGTIFLDEVGELSQAIQRKLLRVLQEKEVRRLGSTRSIRIDFRLVSATNRSLENMVESGEFRQDLFFRLNVATIYVPPLRERREDIPILVHHFLRSVEDRLGGRWIEFTEEAMAVMENYSWPGNVRELQNEVLRIAGTESGRIGPERISSRIRRANPPSASVRTLLPKLLGDIEREAIRVTLRDCKGNRAETARLLGITRTSLYRKIERYGIICEALPPPPQVEQA